MSSAPACLTPACLTPACLTPACLTPACLTPACLSSVGSYLGAPIGLAKHPKMVTQRQQVAGANTSAR